MFRTPRQRRLFIAAILVGAGPLAAGTIAALSPRHDFRMIAMAVASGIATFALLTRGRAKATAAISALSLALGTVVAAGLAFALGARAPFGIWAVAFVLALFWSVCALLYRLARPDIAAVMSERATSARHVPATQSPFGIDGWDVTGVTQSMVSTTQDPKVAESFMALRTSFGAEYRGQAVPDGIETPCDLRYAYGGEIEDGAVYKARRMEEKWDIYLYKPYMYFCRSWRGELAYRARVEFANGGARLTSIMCSASEEPEFARRAVDYLVRSHLFGQRVPHPLPATLPADDDEIAALSFSMFGRKCGFGSYADTTLVQPL